MNELSFERLRRVNVKRCNEAFRPLEDWSPTDWGCAMAGEAGEACNLLKKMLRGEDVPLDHVAAELADVVTYVDLLAARLGIDLGAAVVRKFDIVSRKRGSDIFLGEGGSMMKDDALFMIAQYCVAMKDRGCEDPIIIGLIDRFPADGSGAKAMRWLGFMQGALYAQGAYTLEDLKQHSLNRSVSD